MEHPQAPQDTSLLELTIPPHIRAGLDGVSSRGAVRDVLFLPSRGDWIVVEDIGNPANGLGLNFTRIPGDEGVRHTEAVYGCTDWTLTCDEQLFVICPSDFGLAGRVVWLDTGTLKELGHVIFGGESDHVFAHVSTPGCLMVAHLNPFQPERSGAKLFTYDVHTTPKSVIRAHACGWEFYVRHADLRVMPKFLAGGDAERAVVAFRVGGGPNGGAPAIEIHTVSLPDNIRDRLNPLAGEVRKALEGMRDGERDPEQVVQIVHERLLVETNGSMALMVSAPSLLSIATMHVSGHRMILVSSSEEGGGPRRPHVELVGLRPTLAFINHEPAVGAFRNRIQDNTHTFKEHRVPLHRIVLPSDRDLPTPFWLPHQRAILLHRYERDAGRVWSAYQVDPVPWSRAFHAAWAPRDFRASVRALLMLNTLVARQDERGSDRTECGWVVLPVELLEIIVDNLWAATQTHVLARTPPERAENAGVIDDAIERQQRAPTTLRELLGIGLATGYRLALLVVQLAAMPFVAAYQRVRR